MNSTLLPRIEEKIPRYATTRFLDSSRTDSEIGQIKISGPIWKSYNIANSDLGGLGPAVPTDVDPVEVLEALVGPLDHRLLGGPDPDTGVVELLVGLVGSLGVADLQEEPEVRYKVVSRGEGGETVVA